MIIWYSVISFRWKFWVRIYERFGRAWVSLQTFIPLCLQPPLSNILWSLWSIFPQTQWRLLQNDESRFEVSYNSIEFYYSVAFLLLTYFYFKKMSAENPTGNVDLNDLVPFCGLLCCFESCFLEWPDMIGCAGKSICLCYYSESVSCKFPKEEGTWWLCGKGHSWLAPITVCCSIRSQMCCLDVRGSLPPSEEVPSVVTICFYTILYKNQLVLEFMKPVKDLEAKIAAAPAATQA